MGLDVLESRVSTKNKSHQLGGNNYSAVLVKVALQPVNFLNGFSHHSNLGHARSRVAPPSDGTIGALETAFEIRRVGAKV